MASWQRISLARAHAMLAKGALAVDIRDRQSYELGHLANAEHLDNHNLASFVAGADLSLPVIVYCYHGNSSQGAAAYLSEQGFDRVYSMDGGFEEWRLQYPTVP